jgi:hypothetical protein
MRQCRECPRRPLTMPILAEVDIDPGEPEVLEVQNIIKR